MSNEFREFLHLRDIRQLTSAVYNPQQNGRVEVWGKFLKQDVQTFQGGNFEGGVQKLLLSYRAIGLTPNSCSPAELFLQRKIRASVEPALRERPMSPPQPASKENIEISNKQQLRYRGRPYQLGDMVRTKLPHASKGCSPFSEPRQVTRVCGNYTYELSDGQIWNARKLVRVRPLPPATISIEGEIKPRRSQRTNRGVPPARYQLPPP